MAKYERDTHEPDDVRVFDGGEDDGEEGGSHLPVVIIIAGLVLAAFGGVVWLAYNNGVARGRSDVPAAVAQNTANEQPAAAPGSGALPVKQIKVYQQQAGSDEVDQEPATAPPAQSAKPAGPPAWRSQLAEAKPTVVPPVQGAAVTVPKPAPVTQSALPPAKATLETVVAEAPATPVAKAAAKPATPPKATTATGAFVLQIGAYKSQSDADAAWKSYRVKHAALLSGFGPNVQKAELGDKGVWYRLRVGSFADKDAAAALCDRLKAEGGVCFPAK
ncbi:MAG: SPOR domain-containing protein [Rhizomicrobium sp.]|jgi:cell division protein FtsN